jgi:hypothetical protein
MKPLWHHHMYLPSKGASAWTKLPNPTFFFIIVVCIIALLFPVLSLVLFADLRAI